MATPHYDAGATRTVWLGIMLGTAALVLAMWGGARYHFGAAPGFLAVVVGTVLLWVVFVVAAIAAAMLLAMFGRELAQVIGSLLEDLARAVSKAAGALFGRAHRWAEPRYHARRPASQPGDSDWLKPGQSRCEGCKGTGRNKDGSDACPVCRGWGSAPDDPGALAHPDGTVCRACGNPGTLGDPVVGNSYIHRSHAVEQQAAYRSALERETLRPGSTPAAGTGRMEVAKAGTMTWDDGRLTLRDWELLTWIPRDPSAPARRAATDADWDRLAREYSLPELHEMSHGKDCNCPVSGLNWPESTRAASPQTQQEGTQMAAPTTQVPRTGAPGGWKSLAADTADFEPDSDAELLDWMSGEVAGMGTYGESLISVYEHCTDSKGIDPAAMAAMHDTADAVADAAQAMAYARQKFASVYEQVREAVSNGLVLPHDGRWITGEGEA